MRDVSMFATGDRPLHPSALRNLLLCPWRAVLEYLGEDGSESGAAADTGSAMHAAAAAFHRGQGVAGGLEAMTQGAPAYPRADLQDAAKLFLAYASDPRNRCNTPLIEAKVRFAIRPSAQDPTQAPIEVEGTVDQVREHEGGILRVWDIKSSKRDPATVRDESTHQIAAYCIGASLELKRRVEPGGVILPRRYGADPSKSNVFWPVPWSFEDVEHILEGVREQVALIRAGRFYHVPNPDCNWCHQRAPHVCLPKLVKLRLRA